MKINSLLFRAKSLTHEGPGIIKELGRDLYKENDIDRSTDLDIEFEDLIIQVKVGRAKGLITQMNNSATTGKTVISFTPDLPQSSVILKNVRAQVFETFTTFDEVLEFLSEFLGS